MAGLTISNKKRLAGDQVLVMAGQLARPSRRVDKGEVGGDFYFIFFFIQSEPSIRWSILEPLCSYKLFPSYIPMVKNWEHGKCKHGMDRTDHGREKREGEQLRGTARRILTNGNGWKG